MQARCEPLTTTSSTGVGADHTGSGSRCKQHNTSISASPLQGGSGAPPGAPPDNGAAKALPQATITEELAKELRRWAADAKERFPELKDKRVAAVAGKVFAKAIKPPSQKRGRPLDDDVTTAMALLGQNIARSRIPSLVYPDRPWEERRNLARKLFHAIYMRRKRKNANPQTCLSRPHR
jgi:hypothetical protein